MKLWMEVAVMMKISKLNNIFELVKYLLKKKKNSK